MSNTNHTTNMPFEISIDKNNQMIHLTSKGEQFASEAAIASTKASKLARKHGYNHFLVNLQEAIVKDSTMESYAFVDSLPQMGFHSSDKIAIVVNAAMQEEVARHRFSETLALNRGFDVKLFFTNENALGWLKER